MVLKPGEQAVSPQQEALTVQTANLEEVAAWRNGKFLFKRRSIEEIMRQISRWYDVEVVFDGKLPEDHFSGKISRNVNASGVLNILAASGINFKIEGRKIILK